MKLPFAHSKIASMLSNDTITLAALCWLKVASCLGVGLPLYLIIASRGTPRVRRQERLPLAQLLLAMTSSTARSIMVCRLIREAFRSRYTPGGAESAQNHSASRTWRRLMHRRWTARGQFSPTHSNSAPSDHSEAARQFLQLEFYSARYTLPRLTLFLHCFALSLDVTLVPRLA